MTQHDLDGFILKRAMAVDDAMADGTYATDWVDVDVQLPVDVLEPLRLLAWAKGVNVVDLIVAITEKRARELLQEELQL